MKLAPWWVVACVALVSCAPSEVSKIPEPQPAVEPDESETQRSAPGPCDVVTEREMSDSIGAQIDALRAGDYPAAYEWAAPGFQQNVSLEVFEIVIREGYSSLLDARSHTLSDCVVFPRNLGNTVVTVTTVTGGVVTYYYEMIETNEGWRILGAAEIAPVSSGA